jgi:hypothetical protein
MKTMEKTGMEYWIRHFRENRLCHAAVKIPDDPVTLPEETRRALARSLAVFQLGESGGGTRIRRYARAVADEQAMAGYQEAVTAFIAEEQSHSEMLGRLVRRLGGSLLEKQWTNSVFRRLRGFASLEITIQLLLTAELVAEVYYAMLLLRVEDAGVRNVCRQIVRDEVRHLEFQREFLARRLAGWTPAWNWLWRLQFRVAHSIVVRVVAMDHADCLRVCGVSQAEFRERCTRSRQAFERRLDIRRAREASPPVFRLQPVKEKHVAARPPLAS